MPNAYERRREGGKRKGRKGERRSKGLRIKDKERKRERRSKG